MVLQEISTRCSVCVCLSLSPPFRLEFIPPREGQPLFQIGIVALMIWPATGHCLHGFSHVFALSKEVLIPHPKIKDRPTVTLKCFTHLPCRRVQGCWGTALLPRVINIKTSLNFLRKPAIY